jgi:Glycosyltransferases, probably involved in cell wall biogenesis
MILFLSVVIPTYNRPEQLKTCLSAIAGLDYPRDRFEVIVVDDGSSESLESVVSQFRDRLNVTLLTQPNTGPAAARNTGAAQAKGTFLAFTDDDCIPVPEWLRALVHQLAENPDCLIGGRTVNALPENPFSTASQLLVDYLYSYYNREPDRALFFTSNNMALPADRFRELGGFDVSELRATAEDRELCDRWLYRGYRMTYAPKATVCHAHSMTLLSFLYQHFNYGRGAFYYRKARARRGQEPVKIEPLSFYLNLLLYPFSGSAGWRGFPTAALLAISQMANAAGFFWEQISQRLRNSERASENQTNNLLK